MGEAPCRKRIDYQDLYFRIAEETAALPNKDAWQEITKRLKATNHTWGLCAVRDNIWAIRAMMRELQSEPLTISWRHLRRLRRVFELAHTHARA